MRGVLLALSLVIAAGCDLRTLQQDQLVGERAAAEPPDSGGVDRVSAEAAGEVGEVGEAGEAGEAGGGTPDGGPGCPAVACEPFESCDLPTKTCKLRTGPGMLSGSVLDACTRRALTARVGIAGRRQCVVDGKGAYFFANLPEGTLALIAFKDGYQHFEVPVVISAAGTVKDILLVPDTPQGCAQPPPPDAACICNLPGCP